MVMATASQSVMSADAVDLVNHESLQHQLDLPWQLDPRHELADAAVGTTPKATCRGRLAGRTSRYWDPGTWSGHGWRLPGNSTLSPAAMRWPPSSVSARVSRRKLCSGARNRSSSSTAGNALRVGDELGTLLGCSTGETASHRARARWSHAAEGQREHQPRDVDIPIPHMGEVGPDYRVMRSPAGSRRRCLTSRTHRSTMVSSNTLACAVTGRVVQELQGILADLRACSGSSPNTSAIRASGSGSARS